MNRGNRFRQSALALLLALLLGLSTPVLAKSRSATVVVQSADVREKPRASAKSLGSLPKGTQVEVTEISGKLARIQYAGKAGYVKKSALRLAPSGKQKVEASVKPKAQAQTTKKTTVRAIAYLKPSKSCKQRTVVRKGTSMTLLGVENGFYKVRRAGVTAYMLKSAFEEKAEKPAPPAQTRTVRQKSRVFKRASRSSQLLGTLAAGEKVQVLKESKSYVKIERNGRTGFVPASAFDEAVAPPAQAPKPTEPPAPANPGSVNASKANKVISAAMAQLGKPYVYGSIGPNSFDCSGLTYYAYRTVGLSLAHSAQSVGYSSGKKVSRSQLERGDIACFNTVSDGDLSDHVGIYLGDNQFVHASSGQRRVVTSTLTGYYQTNFSWGRRVL